LLLSHPLAERNCDACSVNFGLKKKKKEGKERGKRKMNTRGMFSL
jgi:hypothetical protein